LCTLVPLVFKKVNLIEASISQFFLAACSFLQLNSANQTFA